MGVLMKKNLLKLTVVSAVFVLGVSLATHFFDKQITQVDAAQVIDNFDDYSYSGTYYDEIGGTEGLNGTLRTALTTKIHPKDWYTYGGGGSDHLSTQLQYADEDPTNKSNMIYLYTRDSVKKNAASSWNREHVWPQSNSNDCWGTGSGGGSDLLHIRPTYNDTNNSRGNLKYGEMNKTGEVKYNGMTYGYKGGYFEPIDSVKGDVARIIMYVWTAYKNHYSNLPAITSTFQSYDVLLKWHTMDKPDVMEGNRNDYSEKSIQKNRNPFVDHPEYAWKIFGNEASANVKAACQAAYPEDGSGTTTKTMTGIALSREATAKVYYEGEHFNPNGLTVTAKYDDNSTKTVPSGNCTWAPDPLTKGTTSVTCTYNGFTATYDGITVKERDPSESGTYTVEFTKTSDTGDNISESTISQYYASNTLVSSASNLVKIFPGKSGLKIGSSSSNGSITFNFKQEAQNDIANIEIETTDYNGSGTYETKLNNTVLASEQPAGTTLIKSFDGISASSLTISSSGRMYINSITIEVKGQTPSSSSGDSSSSDSSSSVAPSSSEDSSVIPSSSSEEVPHSSSQESSSAPSSSENKETPTNNHGCNGSIIGVSSFVGFTSLIGLIFLFSKKKK